LAEPAEPVHPVTLTLLSKSDAKLVVSK